MKIPIGELKSIVKDCIDEILSEVDTGMTPATPDEDPKVKNLRKRVEIDKQKVEREKQKSLSDRLRAAKQKRSDAVDLDAKKVADAEIKDIVDKNNASRASLNAAIKTASSIK